MKSVILLRGINVGGNNKLPMKELCALLEGLGAENPRHYIQSGNIVTGGTCEEETIANAIKTAKGFQPSIMIFSAEAFREIAQQVPFDEPVGKLVHIWFAKSRFTFDQAKADTLIDTSESLYITDKAIFLHAPNGIGRSKLAEKIEALANVPCTARNMNTVNKLLDMLDT